MPGVGPAAEVLLVRQKAPKPLTPRLGWVFTGVHRSVSEDGMAPRGEYFENYLE